MKKPNYPYRQFLKSVVATRKYLLKTDKSKQRATHIPTTIMLAEDILNRMPSERTVQLFCQRYYDKVLDLIPAQPNDKRIKTLNEIVRA